MPTPETVNLRSMFFAGLPSVSNCKDVPKLVVGWSDRTYVSAVGVNVRVVGKIVWVGVDVGDEEGPGVIVPVLENEIEAVEGFTA